MRFRGAKPGHVPGRGPVFDAAKCTGCGDCIEFCQAGLLSAGEGGVPVVARSAQCPAGCRTCARVCPTGAATFEDEEFFIDYIKRRLAKTVAE